MGRDILIIRQVANQSLRTLFFVKQITAANEALEVVQQQYAEFQRRFEDFQTSSAERHEQREEFVDKLTAS